MQAQASRLQELMKREQKPKHTKFIAVTSGKGGVGKSTVSANIGNLLANSGYKVALFDADIGLANLDVILNVKVGKNLLNVLKGECTLSEIVKDVKPNLKLIPGDSGGEILEYAKGEYFDRFLDDAEILDDLDFMIIDTGAGISQVTTHFLKNADEVIVVTTPDPAAITDAYATLKVCSKDRDKFFMFFNIVQSEKEALDLFSRINKVALASIEQHPSLSFLGCLQSSQNVIDCIKSRTLFTQSMTRDTMNLKKAVNSLLASMEQNVLSDANEGSIKSFFRRLIDRI